MADKFQFWYFALFSHEIHNHGTVALLLLLEGWKVLTLVMAVGEWLGMKERQGISWCWFL